MRSTEPANPGPVSDDLELITSDPAAQREADLQSLVATLHGEPTCLCMSEAKPNFRQTELGRRMPVDRDQRVTHVEAC